MKHEVDVLFRGKKLNNCRYVKTEIKLSRMHYDKSIVVRIIRIKSLECPDSFDWFIGREFWYAGVCHGGDVWLALVVDDSAHV